VCHHPTPGWWDGLRECHEIRRPDEVDANRPIVRQAADGGKCGKPAEGAAVDADPIVIHPVLCSEPLGSGLDIFQLVAAPIVVYQPLVTFAIAGGTANIRGENSDIATRQILVK